MKEEIHPKYFPNAKVVCACGNSWTTGSTSEVIRTEICSQCHPFFTGEQRIVDTEGQVDRFYKKLQARQKYVDDRAEQEAERVSPERLVAELDISKRAIDTLKKAGVTSVGDVMTKLEVGESALLEIDGFGRKSLSDLKKRLRQIGYELPEAADQIVV
jgi:large subunit ribosomal protein L31